MQRTNGCKENSRDKLLNIICLLRDNITDKHLKIPKNFHEKVRKLYKYIKPIITLLNVNFDNLDQIDEEKKNLLGIDDLCVKLKINVKQWIFELFSALNYQNEINFQMECYLLNCFNVIKEVCRSPPKNLAIFSEKYQINKEIFYILLDYFIILEERKIFEDFFDLILYYSENCNISYKFLVIQKKFIIKYFNDIIKNDNEIENIACNDILNYDISNSPIEVVKVNHNYNSESSDAMNLSQENSDNKITNTEKLNENNFESQENTENQQYIIIETADSPAKISNTNIQISNPIINNSSHIKKENVNKKEIYKKFMEFCLNSLKINVKDIEKSSTKSGIFPFSIFFSKNKSLISKELDGTNIIDFFTILNICEEYSFKHLNNIAVFSVSYELIKFLFEFLKKNNIPFSYISSMMNNVNITSQISNSYIQGYYDESLKEGRDSSSPQGKIINNPIFNIEKILYSIKDIKMLLHSYCLRIFDQSENYLESNKNKTVIDKTTEYNLNLIEASVWESLKIINLICKLDPSLVSNINMRMKQVYERIALKQSGLVVLEILQFFIDNCEFIIIDLDYYVSQFFKSKLKFNYKFEMLSFKTLEFLFKNKSILNLKTQVFNQFFPLIIKIFSTFPKYLDTKFFSLVEYMTKPTTINELFNYILDLPAIILIIENFESFVSINGNNSNNSINNTIPTDEIFQPDYAKLINFMLRDEAFGQDNMLSFSYLDSYDKKLKFIFENLIFTSRVHSTTKIVPKLMKNFFDVIIRRDESQSALETIILIFERFSHFHENDHYKQEIRNLLIRKLEEIFYKWPNIVSSLREKIISEVRQFSSDQTKRELICLLCWSLGEFLDKDIENSFEDKGILETFECLEKLLQEKIKYVLSNKKENIIYQREQPVEEILKWYNTYFIEKTTSEEISNERLLIIIITSLGKLAIKFKNFVSRTINKFKEILNKGLDNKNICEKLGEILVRLKHISVSTEKMGSEMSCPCTSRPPIEGEMSEDEKDVRDIISKRFNKEDMIFTSEVESTKICIIESEKIEAFLKNKNNLRYNIKKELNVLYNNVNFSNCINNNSLVLIILEYIYDGKQNLNDSNEEDKYVFKRRRVGLSDTILNYKVINFSLVTSDPSRIIDLIKMNVNNMLKSDFLFAGVVNSSKEKSKEYKLIFKKILKYTFTITYHIITYEGILTHPVLDKIIKENNQMVIKSVLIFKPKENSSNKKNYFFIFEKCESEIKLYDNLVVEMRRKQMPDNIYYADLATKLSNLNKDIYNYKLTCLINDEDSIFFILNEESSGTETPDTNI